MRGDLVKLFRSIVAVAALLSSPLAFGQAYRVGAGVALTPGTAAPTAASTRGVLWVKSSDSNKLWYCNPAGSCAAVSTSSAGTVTSITMGTGLSSTQSPLTSTGTMSVDTAVVATTSNSLTMASKTLTAPIINGATSASGNFDLSGSSGTFKTSTGAATFGGSSNTFSSGAIGPASGQQHTLPAVSSDTIALLTASQTLAAKTLTAPVINGATSSGSTSIDFSGNSGTFKTSTGAITLGNAAIALTANTVFTGASSATNTVGIKHTANVTDGASTIAHVLDNTAAITSGELLEIRSAGNKRFSLYDDGSVAWMLMNRSLAIVQNSSGDGLYLAGGIARFRIGSSGVVSVDTTAHYPDNDSSISSGKASQRFIAGYFGAAIGSQAACSSTTRGAMMTVFATTGNSDTHVVCMKAAADTYAWRTVYTAP